MSSFDEFTKKVLGIEDYKCTGCMACKVICPRDAISIVGDKEGYKYPRIDDAKCVKCGKCRKTCPISNVDREGRVFKSRACYVGNSKNLELLQTSSSGAIFAEVATHTVANAGCVAGAVYDDDYRSVHHIVSSELDDVQKMKGSKYCKSRSYEVYEEVYRLVKSGQTVLFSGVGCECAAVKKICEKYLDKLVLVQIVCKGAMTDYILDRYIGTVQEKNERKVVHYTMRYKNNVAIPAYEYVCMKDETTKMQPYYETLHGKLYASDALLRNSCYNCAFRGESAVGDIIIGDAPFVPNLPNAKMGCSTIVINSVKGEELIERLDLNLIRQKQSDVRKRCKRLILSPHRPWGVSRKKIFLFIKEMNSDTSKIERYFDKKKTVLKIQRKLWKLIDSFKCMLWYSKD